MLGSSPAPGQHRASPEQELELNKLIICSEGTPTKWLENSCPSLSLVNTDTVLLKRSLWARFLRISFLPLSSQVSAQFSFLKIVRECRHSEDERSGGRPIKSLSCSTLSDDLEEVEHIVHSWRNTSYTTTVRNVTNHRRSCFVNRIQIEVM
jgi:hypothetical protein